MDRRILAGALMVMTAVWTSLAWGEEEVIPSGVTFGAEVQSVQPGGTYLVGLKITLARGWHTYWTNPGDGGTPLMMNWKLPAGVKISPFQWPVPEAIPGGPLMTYGHHGETVLSATLSVDPGIRAGSNLTLRGEVTWQVCLESCFMLEETVQLILPVKSDPPTRSSVWSTRLEKARAKCPVPSSRWSASAAWKGRTWELTVTPGSPQDAVPPDVYFFAADPMTVESSAPQEIVSLPGGGIKLVLRTAQVGRPSLSRLRGVAASRKGWGRERWPGIFIDAEIREK